MVTGSRTEGNNDISTFSFKGLSSDSKPTEIFDGTVIKNGSAFFEMDTQEVYFYDGDSKTWLAQP